MKEFLKDRDIAEELSVPEATVRYWRYSGRLPYSKAGRHPLVRREDLERFIEMETSQERARQNE